MYIMGACEVLVGVVCLPKHLNPSSSQPSCLCCLFVLSSAKNTYTFIGTCLHIYSPVAICRWSMARVAHTGVCSLLVHSFISVTLCLHIQVPVPKHSHLGMCVHAHIYTCISSLCIHVWEVPVHRMCVLIRSPQGQARIHNSAQGQACEYTQVLMPTYPCRYSHVCWEELGIQVALLSSSIDANRPSLFWSGPKI